MQYKIEGGSLPVIICELEAGEIMMSESGGKSWVRGNVKTETTSAGGVGKMLGRMVSGESLFLSKYTAQSNAQIAFASSFPGSIVPIELAAGQSIIAQKSAYMASTKDVVLSMHFKKKLGAGLFGGEGFIMQKIEGPGTVFLEIDGHCHTMDLSHGERMECDTGLVAYMDSSCSLDIEVVSGLKNIAFGREGIFNTVVTGPGKVAIQTMPINKFASLIAVNTGK